MKPPAFTVQPKPNPRRQLVRTAAGAMCLFFLSHQGLAADPITSLGAPAASTATGSAAILDQLVRRKYPTLSAEARARIREDFVDHLRATSPVVAESLGSGTMNTDDLASRLDIFLADHPEYFDRSSSPAARDPSQRVADLIGSAVDLAPSEAQRQTLVTRFLASLDGTSRANLEAGRMSQDELKSRTDVFVSDLRAEAARVPTDPSIAAVPPILDAFVKANYGSASERVESICYRGTLDENGTTRNFVIFKKRPNLLRIHLVQNDLVVGLLGFDGREAWTEWVGKPAAPAGDAQARDLARTAQFDDPLVGYAERGAVVRLQDRPANGPLVLHIQERDGSESVATIDPATNHQTALRSRRPGEEWREMRFSDYRKVGTISVAFAQEQWSGGTLRSRTRFSDVALDPGLLDRFFQRPPSAAFDFMDFMNGLAVIERRQKRSSDASPAISLAR